MLESNPARRIIAKFGGISRMAMLTDFPKSTIQRWNDSGRIGPHHNPRILDAAASNSIMLEVADFVDVDFSHPAFLNAVATPSLDDTGDHVAGSSPDPIPENLESLAPDRGFDDRVCPPASAGR